jgi:two-component system, OmpR family, phosphate regulon sensor histidine kinase PhoR
MKASSSEKTALLLALIISFIVGATLAIFSLLVEKNAVVFSISIVLILFITLYISIYYILNNYILKRIKPVFDTIDSLQMPAEQIYQRIEDGSLIEEIDKRMMKWARNKVDEIDVLKANEKYRKEFLGNISHELKTPLFNIQGYILTLIDGGINDAEINMKYLKRTDKNINRLISIVQDLETISKLETGERLLDIQVFDIVLLISEVFEMQEIRANKKRITIKFSKNYPEPILVRADKKGIMDVLGNLIINSIIYGKEGGTTIVDIEARQNLVFISVKDNGIGIEEKYQSRIFERFFRIDKSRSKIQGGTGLGLAIVKHTIEAHKQKITVESKPDIGTKFRFSLEKV